jgi:hypothetical protein
VPQAGQQCLQVCACLRRAFYTGWLAATRGLTCLPGPPACRQGSGTAGCRRSAAARPRGGPPAAPCTTSRVPHTCQAWAALCCALNRRAVFARRHSGWHHLGVPSCRKKGCTSSPRPKCLPVMLSHAGKQRCRPPAICQRVPAAQVEHLAIRQLRQPATKRQTDGTNGGAQVLAVSGGRIKSMPAQQRLGRAVWALGSVQQAAPAERAGAQECCTVQAGARGCSPDPEGRLLALLHRLCVHGLGVEAHRELGHGVPPGVGRPGVRRHILQPAGREWTMSSRGKDSGTAAAQERVICVLWAGRS